MPQQKCCHSTSNAEHNLQAHKLMPKCCTGQLFTTPTALSSQTITNTSACSPTAQDTASQCNTRFKARMWQRTLRIAGLAAGQAAMVQARQQTPCKKGTPAHSCCLHQAWKCSSSHTGGGCRVPGSLQEQRPCTHHTNLRRCCCCC